MESKGVQNINIYIQKNIQHVSHCLLQIKLVDKDNSPISNEVIQLFVNNRNTDNFTTDHHGVAEFSIDTSEMLDPEISLKVSTKQGWIETKREMDALKLNPKTVGIRF